MGEDSKPPEVIKEGSVIFLYNVDDRSLLGPFTALEEGGAKLDAGTWRMDIDTKIPSEDLMVTWENLHVLHNADEELPFLRDLKTCKLGSTTTQRVLDLLAQSKPYLYDKEVHSH